MRTNLVIWQGLTKDPGAWGALYPILSASNVTIRDFALSPDGSKLIVVGTQNNDTNQVAFYSIYDLTNTSDEVSNSIHAVGGDSVTAVEFTPDSSLFVLATGEGNLLFMDSTSNTLVRSISNPTQPVAGITFKDDGTLMATIFENSVVMMWRIN